MIKPADWDQIFCYCNNHGICFDCIIKLMNENKVFLNFMRQKYGPELNNLDCWTDNNLIPIRFCKNCSYNEISDDQYRDFAKYMGEEYNINLNKEK